MSKILANETRTSCSSRLHASFHKSPLFIIAGDWNVGLRHWEGTLHAPLSPFHKSPLFIKAGDWNMGLRHWEGTSIYNLVRDRRTFQ